MKLDVRIYKLIYDHEYSVDENKELVRHIKQALLDEVEGLDYYPSIEQCEDDSGRTHTTNMGDSVLIEDIKDLLGGT